MRRSFDQLAIVLITASCGSHAPSAVENDASHPGSDIYDHGLGSVTSMPVDSGSDANFAPSADEITSDADAGPMLDLEWGGAAVFHDAQGNEIGRANAPTRFPLPDGGSVTFGIGFETFTILDVPAGATLRPFIDGPYAVRQQSIRINIVDRPGMTIVASTGCGSATGPGTQVLAMNDDCLENGKGELFVYAWQNGAGSYIEVKDIAVGAAELDPLDIALPGWTDLPAGDDRIRLDTKGLPDAVTGDVGLYGVRGHRSVKHTTTTILPSDGGVATALADALLPTTGTHWVRSMSFYPGNPVDFDLAPRSYLTEAMAYPLVSPASVDFAALLPIPADLVLSQNNGPVISFTLPDGAATADVDRIAVTFAWGDPKDPFLWHVIAKPGTRRVALPIIPNYLANPNPALVWVEVRAEDHPNMAGWVDVLKDWHDTYFFLSPEQWPSGRISRNVWQPAVEVAD